MTTPAVSHRILRLDEVRALIGVPRSTLYDWMKGGRFPQSIKLGPRAMGWRERDILEWLDSRQAA